MSEPIVHRIYEDQATSTVVRALCGEMMWHTRATADRDDRVTCPICREHIVRGSLVRLDLGATSVPRRIR